MCIECRESHHGIKSVLVGWLQHIVQKYIGKASNYNVAKCIKKAQQIT